MAMTMTDSSPAGGELHTSAIVDCRAPDAWNPENHSTSGRGLAPISPVHILTTQTKSTNIRPKTRNRFIKVRLAVDEYRDVARRADSAGSNVSEYVRSQLAAVHETLDLRVQLNQLHGLIQTLSRPADGALSFEAVLILRELASGRDAQLMTRVRAQLARQGGV